MRAVAPSQERRARTVDVARSAATSEPDRTAAQRALRGAPPALPILVGHDGRDDDAAFDNFLVVRVDVEKGEPRGQNPKDHGADHGAGHAPDAARKRGPADDRGGDRVEFEADADARLAAD